MTKVSVEEVSPIERRIRVEIEPEVVQLQLENAYRMLSRQVRVQASNRADLHTGAFAAATLEIAWFHAKLRDRRAAVDLHHLYRRAERCQSLLNQPRALLDKFLVDRGCSTRIKDLLHIW